MDCSKCPKPLAEKDAIKCSGCQQHMHYICAEMQESDFKKILPMNKIKWKCPACKIKKNLTSTSAASAVSSPKQTLDENMSILNIDTDALTVYLDKKFLTLRQQWSEDINKAIKDATNTLKGELEKFESRLSKCEENVQRLDQKLESMDVQDGNELRLENDRLRKDLDGLQTRLDDLDQSARICNIEIQNIPEKKGENLVQLAGDIGRLIGVQLSDDKIKAVHRTAHNVPSDRPKNIVIQLTSRRLRDDVIAAARARRELSTADLFPKTTAADVARIQRFYINEHLTLKKKNPIWRSAQTGT
ncbi:uncharacterized protein LOC125229346 [Leguminivora glycinivorella]|uniref:uncharacterized protein LOC125229346 n=1 Tax=Leguminivora glycinivorella TaxID=1035111 RepID=UPI00200DE6F7|nr:uncharacterized protein LOC125229346 [Leguminivora glycinivorella]